MSSSPCFTVTAFPSMNISDPGFTLSLKFSAIGALLEFVTGFLSFRIGWRVDICFRSKSNIIRSDEHFRSRLHFVTLVFSYRGAAGIRHRFPFLPYRVESRYLFSVEVEYNQLAIVWLKRRKRSRITGWI